MSRWTMPLRWACSRALRILQRTPAHVLDDEIPVSVLLAYIQQVHDIVMGHLAGGFRLPLKAGNKLRILIELRAQHLHRHIMPGAQVHRLVDDGHTAHANLLRQPVAVRENLLVHSAATSSRNAVFGL